MMLIILQTVAARLCEWPDNIVGLSALIMTVYLFGKLTQKNRQLQKTLNEIRRHNRTKDLFLGVIAHDLRRPLSSLHGMAKLADYYIKTHRYEKLKKISTSIDYSADKIRDLLENMLHWALSQHEHWQPQSVPVANTVNGILDLYRQNILSHHLQIMLQDPDCLSVLADKNALELILRNLMENALRHLPIRGVLTLSISETAAGRVQIRIEDNGTDIHPEQLKQIKYILAHAQTLIPGQIGRSLGMLLVG